MKDESCYALSDLNVLVIEDDKCMQEIYKVFLARVGILHSDIVDTAEEAISSPLQQKAYHLIICDYELGQGMNGLQLYQLIREKYAIKTPFFIISSVAHDAAFIQECKAKCVTQVLAKPISLECFEEAIHNTIH